MQADQYYLITGAALFVFFMVVYSRPLNKYQVLSLANKRRIKRISRYFKFNDYEVSISKEFKKNLNPNGQFYSVDESLSGFPSVAAALLKYKKHEWVIVAFEKNETVSLLWVNKGISRESVTIDLPLEDMCNVASREDASSVLIFHNHPNSNPNYKDLSTPSKEDIMSAQEIASSLKNKSINLVEFICERGNYYQYYSAYAPDFFIVEKFQGEIESINGGSIKKNLSLHMELIF